MKKESKQKILYWGVKHQIENRPTKNAKGISFTNERRARQENKSFFYSVILTHRKVSDDTRTLSVRGTLDKLATTNSVKKWNFKRYKQGLPQQRPSKNNFEYLKSLVE